MDLELIEWDEIEMNYYSLNDIMGWNYDFQSKAPTFTSIQEILEDSLESFPTLKYGNDLDELLQPLINRWLNPKCYLVGRSWEINWTDSATKTLYLMPILNRLDNVCRTKLIEFNKLKDLLSKTSIDSEVVNTSINRHNDTPTSYGDYSADNYTSDISQTTSTSKSSLNELEMYDVMTSRLRDIQNEIIDEMEAFEIWI